MNIVKDALFGIAVGDALGVPVEFRSRESLQKRPVTGMIGYGSHSQPAGTWSDDSSLTFCFAEALTQGFDLQLTASYFVKWYKENFWTPHGSVFDIGNTTREAIYRLEQGIAPDLAGGFDEEENGNGSLMRIMPLLFFQQDKTIEERFHLTKTVSSITHGHIRSVIACFYYLEFARLLILQKDKQEAYRSLQETLSGFLTSLDISQREIMLFSRLLKEDITQATEGDIDSSGYVLHTLEASIWCLLTTDNFHDAVLKAVNLGGDTDTTGAVTGGLAGLLYGLNGIPSGWMAELARERDIAALADRLAVAAGMPV